MYPSRIDFTCLVTINAVVEKTFTFANPIFWDGIFHFRSQDNQAFDQLLSLHDEIDEEIASTLQFQLSEIGTVIATLKKRCEKSPSRAAFMLVRALEMGLHETYPNGLGMLPLSRSQADFVLGITDCGGN